MKKPLLTVGVSSFLLLAACNANNKNDLAGVDNNRDGNMINVSDRYDRNRYDMYNGDLANGGDGRDGRIGGSTDNDLTTKNELMTDDRKDNFGYVRHQKGSVQGQSVSYRNLHTLDREKTADTISRLSLGLPNINDASVLVTDQEVLVAYDTDAKNDNGRREAAEQVKRTALSVVPRWYHVYVTDDTDLRRDIENIAQINGGMDTARHSIRDTIKLMKQRTPQGYKQSEKGTNGMNHQMNNTNGTTDTKRAPHNTGTPQTTGTPGINWTTGPDDQDNPSSVR
ncbi:YhcN/YlaJ family sporulation lipoprotein [Pseudobacillus badius]|uniref:YhcN/YlaJ family sporulation lipoprotein n=1 Tax=Bacillus badius TaxID=1455 RepID=UPI0007B0640F|nr:YhcN/YlaJ family sporulation lipoprotein [Bacillus badius]KZN99510.1 hypothetical protein A4244_18370 [Bacillus badius]OCS85347.1 hypothetical protein A6M11_18385 [Bacillus badius]OVE50398.1 hypothetical protein B1A98_15930 [Bacillus badius]TDW01298.1 sporulation lipoprotein YhcN/YlaJ [Bacillus badius]